MLGNGTSTARMEAGSMPFFFRPWSTETWMMAPSVGVAITLPLRSCMLVIAESFRTIKCVLGLSLVSIPCPATATTSIPASTALIRSGGVDGAKSNWRPSVPGRTDRFCVTDSVTSRPFLSKKPLSLATHAGSHETTGIYAARTGVSCAAVADTMNPAPIHKILAATTANERDNLSLCATRAPCKTITCYFLLHLVRGEFEAASSAACRLGWNSEFRSDLDIKAHLFEHDLFGKRGTTFSGSCFTRSGQQIFGPPI